MFTLIVIIMTWLFILLTVTESKHVEKQPVMFPVFIDFVINSQSTLV